MARLCFTTILVDDMEKALGFYVDALGFAVIKRDHYPNFVLLQQDTHPVALHLSERGDAAESRVILGIAADDLEALLQSLSAQGVDLVHAAPQRFFGGLYAGVRDPAGNMIELIRWNADAWDRYMQPANEINEKRG